MTSSTDTHGPSPGADEPAGERGHPLPLTGERTLPGVADERYWFERHVVAYRLAQDHVRTAAADQPPVVLDAGCGEGYGLAMLRDAGAGRVVGADLDAATVAHVQRTYAAVDAGIEVVCCELMTLPLADDEADLTVSFQVIEHLHDIPGYLASLRRVTRAGGAVLIATPNRLTFTPGSDVPINPFHTVEFTAAELRELLTACGLAVERLTGVHHGPRLRAAEAAAGAPLPQLLASDPAHWTPELRAVVHATSADDFELLDHHLDASLDLIAVCR